MPQQKPRRISFYLNEEESKVFEEIKAHYGTQSNSVAVRKVIEEHARQLKEPQPTKQGVTPTVTYSRRIF